MVGERSGEEDVQVTGTGVCVICNGKISDDDSSGGMTSHLTDPGNEFRYHMECIESDEQLVAIMRTKLKERAENGEKI